MIPQIKVRLDYSKAAQYGVSPGSLLKMLETLTEGDTVAQIVDGNKRFDVVLRFQDEERTTRGLGDLLIETPTGHSSARQCP